MLSPDNRLTSPLHFREVVRRGRRCGGPLLVVHLLSATARTRPALTGGPRVGFVVSKAVGPAVTRNQVKRRLRHLARERTQALPTDGMLVVRALPAAAAASYAELGDELDRCTKRCLGASRRSPAPVEPPTESAHETGVSP